MHALVVTNFVFIGASVSEPQTPYMHSALFVRYSIFPRYTDIANSRRLKARKKLYVRLTYGIQRRERLRHRNQLDRDRHAAESTQQREARLTRRRVRNNNDNIWNLPAVPSMWGSLRLAPIIISRSPQIGRFGFSRARPVASYPCSPPRTVWHAVCNKNPKLTRRLVSALLIIQNHASKTRKREKERRKKKESIPWP